MPASPECRPGILPPCRLSLSRRAQHAHPGGCRHVLLQEMHESPHGHPRRHSLQQLRDGAEAGDDWPILLSGVVPSDLSEEDGGGIVGGGGARAVGRTVDAGAGLSVLFPVFPPHTVMRLPTNTSTSTRTAVPHPLAEACFAAAMCPPCEWRKPDGSA